MTTTLHLESAQLGEFLELHGHENRLRVRRGVIGRPCLVLHGDSHLHVLGDVRVDNIIYGECNDGRLYIAGSVHGRAFISSDHCMYAEGEYLLPVCAWDTNENWSDCLHPDLLEWDGDEDEPRRSLSTTAIRAFMREGRDPFRPGAQPTLRNAAAPTVAPSPP